MTILLALGFVEYMHGANLESEWAYQKLTSFDNLVDDAKLGRQTRRRFSHKTKSRESGLGRPDAGGHSPINKLPREILAEMAGDWPDGSSRMTSPRAILEERRHMNVIVVVTSNNANTRFSHQ